MRFLVIALFLSVSALGKTKECPTRILLASFDLSTETAGSAIELHDPPFQSAEIQSKLAKEYGPTLTGRSLSPEEYRRRAERFAADTADGLTRTITLFPGKAASPLRLKMHLVTGELLIVRNPGFISAYLQLPVGQRGIANFESTGRLFGFLSECLRVEIPSAPVQLIPRLAAGETLEISGSGFGSGYQRFDHFRKHVLGIYHRDRITVEGVNAGNGRHPPESIFRDIRERYRHGIDGATSWEHDILNEKYAREYESRAVQFAEKQGAHILSLSEERVHDSGDTDRVTTKFDPITHELLVVNRTKQRIITYHEVIPDSDASNRYLAYLGFPPVNTPFEYFLSAGSQSANLR